MTPSELMNSSSTVSSDSFVDEDDDESEGNCREEGGNSSPNRSKEKKTTPKANGVSGNSRFSCLSRRGFIIGLPKVPDTRFKSHDFAARIRCKITGKGCKKPSFTFIPKEAMGNRSSSGNRGSGNNSFKTYEPGSPDVSCVGRIKLKQKDVKKLKTLTSACRKDRQPRKSQGTGKLSWFKKMFNLGRTKVEAGTALPDSRGASSDNPQNLQNIVEEEADKRQNVWDIMEEEEENSRASVPRLSDLKRFASQREPAALSHLFFEDTNESERQIPAAESGDNQSAKVMESNLSEEKKIASKLSEDSKPAEEGGLKKEMAGIVVHSDSSLFATDGLEASARTPPCEINLWKRRSVAAPRALELATNHYGLLMRKPLTV